MYMTATKDKSLSTVPEGSNISNFKLKTIVISGIGIFGALFYGSHLVNRSQTNPSLFTPYTAISQAKDQTPLGFEIVFVIVTLVGFGVMIYAVITVLFNKPLETFINS
jgi:hypothetical protein